ncbi:SurA N-terminal domain-containing protein [Geopseudomonas guangdongensis]|uniref:Periplasmic chaperone PpiD n=1 Tax=Geopseudomonas guangdongensis TaxID=1245526 RepID=A0A1H2IDZ5_9GAMM|nr:SurA N-terminal domain-containing protein [Pseudomonas guangdongensis]SDU42303.1 peptidyl-prolyl cis-trans isomerase D [Pseudomonas guangdongensis]
MLQNIRDNSQGWIAKTIIGVIIVLMALTGFDAIMNVASNRNEAAEVNGEPIALGELSRAVDMQRRQLQQRFGGQFDASLLDEKLLRSSALDALIERKLLLQGAAQAGFGFSQPALDQLILLTPEFQQDGKFSAERFDQVIRQMGYDRLQFRQLLEQEMLIGQLQAGLAGSGFVTEEEVRAFAALERQTRDFASLTLQADSAAVSISDEQLKAYYDEHASEFMTAEQVRIEYVELKKERFFDQVEVSAEELQAEYEKEIANLGEQRKASHILLETGDALNDEQARAKLEELRQRILAGEDFAALAKEFSNDPGSAAAGGDLGYAGQGVYDVAFEEALFALQVGQVSAPVKSEFGWHLIRLDDIQAAEVPSLDSLKPQLERELKTQKVEQRFVEVTKELEDAAFESADLQQPAQELGLEVREAAPFGREGGEGIAANRQVVQAAFSTEVLTEGANSAALELDPDTVVVLRVKEHRKPEQQPLEQLADTLRDKLRREQAAEQARQRGEALLAELREGKAPSVVGEWQSHAATGRDQEGVDPQLLEALFRMPKPASAEQPSFAGLSLANGDYVVLRLQGVGSAGAELGAEELAMYRRFLASRSGQQDFQAFQRQLREQAEIERF